jgi:hypothetical protein
MNSSITFTDKGLFLLAVTALELDSTPQYSVDFDTMTINTDDVDYLVDLFHEQGVFDFRCYRGDADGENDQFRHDGEADGDALASAGMGTDEDYGYFGGGEDE